jgi:hypothetical protein
MDLSIKLQLQYMNVGLMCHKVGGVISVTLGDDEARARKSQKTILERQAPPTFDFLIEMRDRHYWITHQVC